MRLFGHHVHSAFLLLGLVEFIVASAAFASIGSLSRLTVLDGFEQGTFVIFLWALGFGACVVVGMVAMGLYHPRQRLRIEGIVARQIVGLAIATILLAAFDLLFEVEVPAIVWFISSFCCLIVLVLVRLGFDRVIGQEAFRRRVLVLGAGERASSLLQFRRKSDQRGFRLEAFVPSRGDKYIIDDPRVAQEVPSLLRFAQENNINEIVVAMDDRRQSLPIVDLLNCRFAGIDIVDIVHFLERETGRVKIDLVTPDWMIYSAGYTTSSIRDFLLRALDLFIIALGVIVVIPLMVVIAIVILLEDGAPVFYRQIRVGLRGEEFMLLKFRSMIKDAEASGEARWAAANDERVTKVGHFLRKYRLDELAQVINVLRGEMSLVGPRPERPEFVEQLAQRIPYYNERHCVKPGLTGWAQMSYPYGSSADDAEAKLAFDLYYVKHRSLIFNLAVLLQTAEVVLWTKGSR